MIRPMRRDKRGCVSRLIIPKGSVEALVASAVDCSAYDQRASRRAQNGSVTTHRRLQKKRYADVIVVMRFFLHHFVL